MISIYKTLTEDDIKSMTVSEILELIKSINNDNVDLKGKNEVLKNENQRLLIRIDAYKTMIYSIC